MLDRERDAADQTAAADGHDDRVDVGQLVEDLEPDRPLSRDDVVIVERMDERVAVLVFEFKRLVVGVVVDALDEADLGAEAFCRLDLGDGRDVGQTDQRLDAVVSRRERDALRVVARRAGDDSALFLLVGELRDLVVSASDLERTGDLEVLGLEEEINAALDVARGDHIRRTDRLFEDERGVVDFVECEHISPQRSTAPLSALVTSLVYLASQPPVNLG